MFLRSRERAALQGRVKSHSTELGFSLGGPTQPRATNEIRCPALRKIAKRAATSIVAAPAGTGASPPTELNVSAHAESAPLLPAFGRSGNSIISVEGRVWWKSAPLRPRQSSLKGAREAAPVLHHHEIGNHFVVVPAGANREPASREFQDERNAMLRQLTCEALSRPDEFLHNLLGIRAAEGGD